MNSKKARAIRKSLENNGVDVKQVAYQKTMHKKWLHKPDGSIFMQLFTTKRVSGCGRNIYQQSKQNYLSAV